MAYFILLLLVLFAFIAWKLFNNNIIVLSNWAQGFDGIQFSSQEFYTSVRQSIETRKLPEVSFSTATPVTKLRTIVFDQRREYLCVTRGEYRFQICAAPFGTGFFVSWWFLENEPGYISLIKRIPLVRNLLDSKTFYQLDTEEMYRTFVHMCVLEAIDTMTNAKGTRALGEYERRIHNLKQ